MAVSFKSKRVFTVVIGMAGGMPGMPGADEAAAGAAAAGMPDLASMMGGMNPRKFLYFELK